MALTILRNLTLFSFHIFLWICFVFSSAHNSTLRVSVIVDFVVVVVTAMLCFSLSSLLHFHVCRFPIYFLFSTFSLKSRIHFENNNIDRIEERCICRNFDDTVDGNSSTHTQAKWERYYILMRAFLYIYIYIYVWPRRISNVYISFCMCHSFPYLSDDNLQFISFLLLPKFYLDRILVSLFKSFSYGVSRFSNMRI